MHHAHRLPATFCLPRRARASGCTRARAPRLPIPASTHLLLDQRNQRVLVRLGEALRGLPPDARGEIGGGGVDDERGRVGARHCRLAKGAGGAGGRHERAALRHRCGAVGGQPLRGGRVNLQPGRQEGGVQACRWEIESGEGPGPASGWAGGTARGSSPGGPTGGGSCGGVPAGGHALPRNAAGTPRTVVACGFPCVKRRVAARGGLGGNGRRVTARPGRGPPGPSFVRYPRVHSAPAYLRPA